MTEFVWNTEPDGSTPGDSNVPLTRRELRAREQAALEAAASASAPAVLGKQAPPPSVATPPVVSSSSTSTEVFTSRAELFASLDSAKRSVKAPKKPNRLRPVRLPRGTTRPRNAVPSVPRPRVTAPKQRPLKRRLLKKMMAFGAMIGAGLMMVATTIPANAFFPAQEPMVSSVAVAPTETEVQSIQVADAANLTLKRDGYTATSFREQIFLKYGNRSFLYTNNPNGAIQWPFPIAVPITDGFGYRLDPCGFCSPWHKGVDFTPGAGAIIQAIADGVVTKVVPSHAGLGNHVIIDHVVNGQHIQSVYAHMADGSMRVVEGQEVKVGDPVGQVGTTGESTGPHLHFEIHKDGVPIDPFEWLKANATP